MMPARPRRGRGVKTLAEIAATILKILEINQMAS